MIGNLAQIISQAQGGLNQNIPASGGTVVGDGTNINDLSAFSNPMGVDAKSANEISMMGQSQMDVSPISQKAFSRPEQEITDMFQPLQRQEDLMYKPTI